MASVQGERQRGSVLFAAIFGGLLGAGCGAVIGASFNGSDGALIGAVVVGLYWAAAEAITDARRKAGAVKPFLHRVITLTLMAAALAALLGALVSDTRPLLIATTSGILAGLLSLGPRKFVLGVAVGVGVGLVLTVFTPDVYAAVTGGLVMLTFRLLAALLFQDSDLLTIAGERVPPEAARFVVPFEAHAAYIGADYMKTLAEELAGAFTRNPPDIGIVETMDALRGPHFDPALVHPLIREFYEHTTRFSLAIVPHWNPLVRIGFWFFKTYLAQPIGQANLPFNQEEAQRGVVSAIDTVAYGDQTPENVRTLRAWVRTFEASGEAIYVGIYTVVRDGDAGYVSVGFPLPEANFTATLLPYNLPGGHFILKTHNAGTDFTGHYLSDINNDTGALTILKLPTMGEEIEVYVRDGQLKTDHRFFFGGLKFLTLDYTITRKVARKEAL